MLFSIRKTNIDIETKYPDLVLHGLEHIVYWLDWYDYARDHGVSEEEANKYLDYACTANAAYAAAGLYTRHIEAVIMSIILSISE